MYYTVSYFNGARYQTASFNNSTSAFRFAALFPTEDGCGSRADVSLHGRVLTAHLAG